MTHMDSIPRTIKIAVPLLTVIVVLGLVVPTGAVSGDDEVWAEGDLVISPASGPNGDYATMSDDELAIEIPDANIEGTTRVADVFTMTNEGSATMRVWIDHDAPDTVVFERSDGSSIQGEANNVTVAPSETISVGLTIDAGSGLSPGDTLLDEFTIHAESDELGEPTPTPTPTPAPSAGPAGGGGGGEVVAPTPQTPTPSEPMFADGVEVVFTTAVEGSITVREVGMAELEDHPLERENPPPTAVIDPTNASGGAVAAEPPRIRAAGDEAVVQVDQPVVLSGAHSLLGSMRSVDPERRLVRAVDITPPSDYDGGPAIVRITVDESAFEETGLAGARIARRTSEGWQLLPTTIVERSGGEVVLEARTPGMSVFAVFATTSVQYAWEVDNETVSATELRRSWETPGIRTVTLTVRDAFGRTDTATHRVLVNDQPSVTIDAPSNISAGQSTTLRANVTDEFGNATVTWSFPDGSQQTGEVVEHTFESGTRTVQVTAEDEYGGIGTAEATFEVTPAGPTRPLFERLPAGLPEGLGVAAIVALSLLILVLGRVLRDRAPLGWIGELPLPTPPGRAPSIAALEDPTVDVGDRRFRIGRLRIEDPDGDLQTVELAVQDARGNEVARKTMDLRGQAAYTARDEVLLPKNPDAIVPGEAYSITVRAGDRGDRWSDLARSRVPTAVGSGAAA